MRLCGASSMNSCALTSWEMMTLCPRSTCNARHCRQEEWSSLPSIAFTAGWSRPGFSKIIVFWGSRVWLMHLSESPRHCVFGVDIAFAVVFGGFLSFVISGSSWLLRYSNVCFRIPCLHPPSPSWHRNLRRRRALARLSLARGKGTSGQVARLRSHHGSCPPMTAKWVCQCGVMHQSHHEWCSCGKYRSHGIQLAGGGGGRTRNSLTWATANVLTLNPAETRNPKAGGLCQSARSSLLQAQFSKAGIDIVGVQEARTESSQRTAALFHVWSAGAAPGGHLGCELWISVSCGIAPTEVTVAHTDPRRLVCSVASPAFQGAIAVLHAPVDQGEDGDFTWWDQTLCILRPLFATVRNCVVLIDANARLGSIRSSSVGACNPELQSPNGNHFHSLLGALSLKAINTLVVSQPTWKNHRIDYIAASFHLQVVNALSMSILRQPSAKITGQFLQRLLLCLHTLLL